MSDRETIPYADPWLPSGPADYRPLRDPSDDAGPLNGRVVDNGNVLSVVPSKFLSRKTLGTSLVVLVWCAICVAVLEVGDRSRVAAGGHRKNTAGEIILVVVAVGGFLLGPMVNAKLMGPAPWIALDRRAKLIRLPRKGKDYPIAQVVRLQYVSFGHVGLSRSKLSYQGEPPQGELQIVLSGGAGEQVECVGFFHVRDEIRRFAIAFRAATGIPVSRVYQTVSGDWHVEPFDVATGPEKRDSSEA